MDAVAGAVGGRGGQEPARLSEVVSPVGVEIRDHDVVGHALLVDGS